MHKNYTNPANFIRIRFFPVDQAPKTIAERSMYRQGLFINLFNLIIVPIVRTPAQLCVVSCALRLRGGAAIAIAISGCQLLPELLLNAFVSAVMH